MKNYDLKLTGYVGDWDFSAESVRKTLSSKKNCEVHVLIDSLGGNVATALSIAAEFRNHGDVTVHFTGMNASAATIASMGAKKICIDRNAMYLIHKCSMSYFQWASLNSDKIQTEIEELQKMQNDLNTIDANVAQMYAKKCSKSPEQLITLMSVGAWMNATTAKEWGLVDEIEDDGDTAKPKMTATMERDFRAAAIPLPDIPVEEVGLLTRIAKALGIDVEAKADDNKNKKQPKNNSIMKKFTAICALLAVAAIEFVEGKASFDESQLQKIEDAFTEANAKVAEANANAEKSAKEVAEKEAKINELEARVKELEKEPADKSHQVIDDGDHHTDDELNATLEVAHNAHGMIEALQSL